MEFPQHNLLKMTAAVKEHLQEKYDAESYRFDLELLVPFLAAF